MTWGGSGKGVNGIMYGYSMGEQQLFAEEAQFGE